MTANEKKALTARMLVDAVKNRIQIVNPELAERAQDFVVLFLVTMEEFRKL